VNTILQKIGAWYDPSGSEFIVWAPFRDKVELILLPPGHNAESPEPNAYLMGKEAYLMGKEEGGYWKIRLAAAPGTRYFFQLDGQTTCPDPASFSQPDGVHGASELVSHTSFFRDDLSREAIARVDPSWKGIPLSDMIIYELHTGAFSPTHDFEGVLQKMDHLVELGINTIELMPLGQFPGDRNWGYDGVFPFAIQNSYGGIPGFRRLVNAAHEKGIAVLVDVIYNHVGPEGNYLEEYGPYFTDKYKTPWGKALNFDDAGSDAIRNYFLQNARLWLEDYQVDGLRLDAVHAIRDFSATHFIQQLKELASEIEQRTKCKKVLIAEIDLNDPRYIDPSEKGGYGLDGQWIDEFHHALRTLMTGDRTAYYEDFGEMGHLEKAFRDTYVYDGNYSLHRMRHFGRPVDNNPYSQFVVFAQNHDQVGNRALGERLAEYLSIEQLKLAASAVLLSPYIPLLFMGEEYGEKNPFAFFVSFTDADLVDAVRKGRKAEFRHFAGEQALPDPQSRATFDDSVLSWDTRSEQAAILLDYYRRLIRLRKTRPALQGRSRDSMIVHPAIGRTLAFERRIVNDRLIDPLADSLFIWLHFGASKTILENTTGQGLKKIWDSASAEWMGPGEITARDIPAGHALELAPHSVVVFEKNTTTPYAHS